MGRAVRKRVALVTRQRRARLRLKFHSFLVKFKIGAGHCSVAAGSTNVTIKIGARGFSPSKWSCRETDTVRVRWPLPLTDRAAAASDLDSLDYRLGHQTRRSPPPAPFDADSFQRKLSQAYWIALPGLGEGYEVGGGNLRYRVITISQP